MHESDSIPKAVNTQCSFSEMLDGHVLADVIYRVLYFIM